MVLQASRRENALQTLSPYATIAVDAEHRIRRFDAAAENIFGVCADDVIGEPLTRVMPEYLWRVPRESAGERRRCDDFIGRSGAAKPFNALRANGEEFAIEVSVAEGAVAPDAAFTLTVRDLTGTPEVEATLRSRIVALERQLAAQKELLLQERGFTDSILDNQPTPVIVLDHEGRVLRMNKACVAASGYELDEMRDTNAWRDFLLADKAEAGEQVFAKLQAGDSPLVHQKHWRHRDGTLRLFSWQCTVIKDDAGKVQYIVANGVDITDKRKAEQQARQHLEEVSRLQRLHTANELATTLAHEINQPLGAIAMYADASRQLLERQPPETNALAENLRRMSDQALRAGDIIRRLRTFVSRGRIDPVPMDLNAVVRSACNLMEPKAESRSVRLELSLVDPLPPVLGVSVHIEQVLLNLIRNAIEAIRDARMGGGSVYVETQLHEDRIRVTVRDTGPGVSPEALARLFDPMFSTKEYGLGVGLRISRSLIEAQGGSLWAESQQPGGIFHFEVPLAP